MKGMSLELIHEQVEMAGYKPGTKTYQREVQKRRIQSCQQLQGVPSCESCQNRDFCQVLKEYLSDTAYQGR